jgi:hypothetical protein
MPSLALIVHLIDGLDHDPMCRGSQAEREGTWRRTWTPEGPAVGGGMKKAAWETESVGCPIPHRKWAFSPAAVDIRYGAWDEPTKPPKPNEALPETDRHADGTRWRNEV